MNIYRTDHIPATDFYGDHRLLEAPLGLEAVGLSLHSLLVNPALLCCLGFSGVISLEVLRPLRSRLQAN